MGDAAAAAIEERKFSTKSPKIDFAQFAQERLGELGETVLATGQSTAVDHLMSEVMSEVSEDCQK